MVYKLTYFNLRGLGEQIRLLLTDNGIPFEEHRFEKDEWSTLKSQFQFGQVPCLFEDGKKLVQTAAIMRHLGRLHGLNGANEEEHYFIDMFHEGARDLQLKYVKMIYTDYDTEKGPFISDILPVELEKFEKLLKTKENGNGFINGSKICYVDYMFFELLDALLILHKSCLDKFPVLKAYHQRMCNLPNLKDYIKMRISMNIPLNGNGKQ